MVWAEHLVVLHLFKMREGHKRGLVTQIIKCALMRTFNAGGAYRRRF